MPAHTSPAAAQAAGHGGDGFRVAPTKVPPRLVSTDLPIGYISCSSLAAPLGLRAGIRVGTRPISGPSGRVDGQVLAVTRPPPGPDQPCMERVILPCAIIYFPPGRVGGCWVLIVPARNRWGGHW